MIYIVGSSGDALRWTGESTQAAPSEQDRSRTMMNTKKLVLVDPAGITGMGEGHKSPHEPIGLSIIGGYALGKNIETTIVCATESDLFDSVERILVQEPTHVGIGAFLYNLPHALRLAGSIKAIDPDVVIIWGETGLPWMRKHCPWTRISTTW